MQSRRKWCNWSWKIEYIFWNMLYLLTKRWHVKKIIKFPPNYRFHLWNEICMRLLFKFYVRSGQMINALFVKSLARNRFIQLKMQTMLQSKLIKHFACVIYFSIDLWGRTLRLWVVQTHEVCNLSSQKRV